MRKVSAVERLLGLLLFFTVYASPSFSAGRDIYMGQDIIQKGLSLVYRFKIKEAAKLFSELVKKQPGSPSALFYNGAIQWGYTQSRLRWQRVAELYAHTPPPKKPVLYADSILEKMQVTADRCKEILQNKPSDFEPLFYLASAFGLMARVEYRQGHFLDAMVDGKRSVNYFEKLLESYPENGDAMLVPGIYRYYVGRLSPPIRGVAWLLGLTGNREEGLALMQNAYDTAVLTGVEAADVLARIHFRNEGDLERGLFWADSLERQAPESILSDYHRLLIYHAMGNAEKEAESADSMLKKSFDMQENVRREWAPLLYFALGSISRKTGAEQQAAIFFRKALEVGNADPWLEREISAALRASPHPTRKGRS